MNGENIDKYLEAIEKCSPDTLIILFSLKIFGCKNPMAELDKGIMYLLNVKDDIGNISKEGLKMPLGLKDAFLECSLQQLIEIFEIRL